MARLDEQDFDEKRLRRRQRRKQGELIAYIILIATILLFAAAIIFGVYFVKGLVQEKKAEVAETEAAEAASEAEKAVIETPSEIAEEPVEYTEDDMLKEIVDTVLSEMPIEDKVAGLFIVTPEQLTGVDTAVKAGSGTQEALTNYAVGGIIYSSKNIKSTDQIKEMLDTTQSMSKYPVFTILSEQGAKSDAAIDTMSLATEQEITDPESANGAGLYVGTQLFKHGFNFEMAPTIEITEDGEFGADADTVKERVSSYAAGLKEAGVTSCSVTFPIKGDTATQMGTIDVSKDDLVLNEYEAFRGVIDSGNSGAIMVSNASFSQITGDNTPASLSSTMIEEELRGTLGFEGIVITSPLDEGSVTEYYTSAEAVVNAIKAGADMVLVPENFTEGYDGLLEAVKSGTITESRIDESLRRIYNIKYAGRVK